MKLKRQQSVLWLNWTYCHVYKNQHIIEIKKIFTCIYLLNKMLIYWGVYLKRVNDRSDDEIDEMYSTDSVPDMSTIHATKTVMTDDWYVEVYRNWDKAYWSPWNLR